MWFKLYRGDVDSSNSPGSFALQVSYKYNFMKFKEIYDVFLKGIFEKRKFFKLI